MKMVIFLIASIFMVTSCSSNGRPKIELTENGEPQLLNQSRPSAADNNLSKPTKTDKKIDSQPVTIIIGDYLDRSLSKGNTEAEHLTYSQQVYKTQGAELLNFLDETYANPAISPYYQYATNQFPKNRIVQSSKASATVADAEKLMALALEAIDEYEAIDQIVINLGTLDFCQSTSDFSSKYQEMLASLLKNKSLKSATFNIVSPLNPNLFPASSPIIYDRKYINPQHQFCPALSSQNSEENFNKILEAVLTEASRLSDERTVFLADISDLPMTFDWDDIHSGFTLSPSGIEKITTALEVMMTE